jgi:ATP-dependent helicase/nuclease subunit A
MAPPETVAFQAQASDPAASAWVTANAGSGKTTVLVRRVLRLLLGGGEPGRILCLTFTTAAAANMANRLFAKLRVWTTLDDAALDEALTEELGRAPTAKERRRARQLFALALETPGGLKIETIHAFCTRVLQCAPFEAGAPPHFTVISDTERAAAVEGSIHRVLAQASGDPRELGRWLDSIAGAIDDARFRALIDEAMKLTAFLTNSDGAARPGEALAADLALALDIDPTLTAEAVIEDTLARLERLVPFATVAAAVAAHGTPDKRQVFGDLLSRFQPGTARERIDVWTYVLIDSKGAPRPKPIAGSGIDKVPALAAALAEAGPIMEQALDLLRRLDAFTRSHALLAVAGLILADYIAQKQRLGVLDYADMIERTRALFEDGAAAWLIYKLDAGIDHLLIDEAQDTSPDQWAILNALTAEFMAGKGQHGNDPPRTLFAVGDDKQSIFGFQGAAPAEFHRQRAGYGEGLRNAGQRFNDIGLRVSFRSTRDIIEAVDRVFARPAAFEGLSSGDAGPTTHATVRGDEPGAVDLWDLVEPPPEPTEKVWLRPVDAEGAAAPATQLARMIATTLKGWILDGRDDLGRPFKAGDALILLPKRKAAFEAVVRELKTAGVPVTGMDRLKLAAHVAVEDLIAAGRAALLPQDDLTVAESLTSPLIGLDDDDLMALCAPGAGSLREALAQARKDRHREAAKAMAAREAMARRLGPFGFYSALMAGGGRRQMLERLGAEASDAIDAFLIRALDFERREGPSLSLFLDAIAATRDDVKRDLAEPGAEVRVMTVHGAKGLEAPVVFLADIGPEPQSPRERLLPLPLRRGNQTGAAPVWTTTAKDDSRLMAAARKARHREAIAESRRLLYVAMTRAEDRLIVCGVRPGKPNALASSWYGLIEAGLAGDGAPNDPFRRIAESRQGVGRRRFKVTPEAAPRPAKADAAIGEAQPAAPDWLHREAPQEAPLLPPLSPSRAAAAADQPDRPGDQPGRGAAAARGRLAHLLLQWLPAVAPEARAGAAKRLALRHGAEMTEAAREQACAEVIALIARPDLAELFGPGSQAEVDIGGRIAIGGVERLVAGRVDRLLITGERVTIADFKTRSRPPRDAGAVDAAARAQMAAYRALARAIHAGRPVRCLLIYTAGPLVIELDDGAMDAALDEAVGATLYAALDAAPHA